MKSLIVCLLIFFSHVLLHARGEFSPTPGRSFELSRLIQEAAEPWGVVQTVFVSGNIQGSATAVCIPQVDHLYFITASHVVRHQRRVQLENAGTAEVVFNDPLMDLALLKVAAGHRHCLRFPVRLLLEEVFDPRLVNHLIRQEVHIEAFDQNRGRIVRSVYDTLMGATAYHGLLGHDRTGPLIVASTRGLSGMSGGALMSFDQRGVVNERFPGRSDAYVDELRFYGMILASSSDGEKVYALSASIIGERLRQFFAGRRTVPNTRYHGDAVQEPRLGITIPSGVQTPVGRFRTGDSGRFRTGDSSTTPSSRGVIEAQGKRWHSIGDLWSAGSPINTQLRHYLRENLRQHLRRRQPIEGIFEDPQGELLRTSHQVNLPQMVRFKLDHSHLDQLYDWRNHETACRSYVGTLKKTGDSRFRYVNFIYCEERRSDESVHFMVMIEDPSRNISSIQIRAVLEFRGQRLFHQSNLVRHTRNRDLQNWTIAQIDTEFRRENLIATTPARSLRVFEFENSRLIAEDNGPLQFFSEGLFDIVAPAQLKSLVFPSRPLSAAVENREWVSEYLDSLEQER